MARLIDADALKEKIEYTTTDVCEHYRYGSWRHGFSSQLVRLMVSEMPTIDAVEVVRCKDCKYWNNGDCYRLELSRPDDFCSYGERKEE